MGRTVTMEDFYALRDASTLLELGTAQGASLAQDGCRIIETAGHQGQEDWATRFADTTVLQLTTFRDKLFEDFIEAAAQFLGERPAPGEQFENYVLRIVEVIEDASCIKLNLMMARNGITLISEVAT